MGRRLATSCSTAIYFMVPDDVTLLRHRFWKILLTGLCYRGVIELFLWLSVTAVPVCALSTLLSLRRNSTLKVGSSNGSLSLALPWTCLLKREFRSAVVGFAAVLDFFRQKRECAVECAPVVADCGLTSCL